MAQWKKIGVFSIALWAASWMAASTASADTDGYSIASLQLHSAGDLVNICSIDPAHEDYEAGRAFCYGFFEGTIRFAEAIAGAGVHKKLVCAPSGTTRLQAVEVFVTFMNDNQQYVEEGPIDAVYRALMPRWPCAD